jgi:hypothetical protein
MPGPHAIALIVVRLATFYLYTRPWIRIELVSLLLSDPKGSSHGSTTTFTGTTASRRRALALTGRW